MGRGGGKEKEGKEGWYRQAGKQAREGRRFVGRKEWRTKETLTLGRKDVHAPKDSQPKQTSSTNVSSIQPVMEMKGINVGRREGEEESVGRRMEEAGKEGEERQAV